MCVGVCREVCVVFPYVMCVYVYVATCVCFVRSRCSYVHKCECVLIIVSLFCWCITVYKICASTYYYVTSVVYVCVHACVCESVWGGIGRCFVCVCV